MVCICVGGRHLNVNGGIGTIEVHRASKRQVADLFSVTAFRQRPLEQSLKRLLKLRKIDAVLRTFWSGNAGCDTCQIKLHVNAVINLPFEWHPEHPLRLKVILESLARFLRTPG